MTSDEHIRKLDQSLRNIRRAREMMNLPQYREDRRHNEAFVAQEELRVCQHLRAALEEANRI